MSTNTSTRALVVPQAQAGRRPRRPGFTPSDLGLLASLIALSALFCFPFLWLVLTSLRPPDEVFAPGFFPSEIHTKNYADVFRYAPVLTWIRNNVIVAVLGVATVVLSSSLVAYGFSRLRFRGRNQIFALVLATQLLPAAVTMVPTFLIWNKLGFVNPTPPGWVGERGQPLAYSFMSLVPLWAGNLFGSAFYIFMLRQFLLTIPEDLMEAARIDGASYLGIYWRIMLPLIKPALVAVAVFEFQAKWNDFITPLIYLNKKSLYTLPIGLATFKTEYDTQWALLMAGSVIFTVPMIVLFFLGQRYFMEGIASTGLKS